MVLGGVAVVKVRSAVEIWFVDPPIGGGWTPSAGTGGGATSV